MSKRTFKAIIFDLDGLMVDTEPIYWDVARHLARQHGKTVDNATLRRMMGRSRMDSIQILATECGITESSPEDLLAMREQMILDRFCAGIKPMPGLTRMLNRFDRKLKLGIATSAPRKFIKVMLPALGLADRFEIVQTGDGIVNGKPDPEIYLKAIRGIEIQPAEAIVLEDAPAGALAGHRAGAYVIAIPTDLTAGEDFSFADAVLTNLDDASDFISRLIDDAN